MRRVLAVLGAVAMVVTAVLVRQALDDDSGGGDGGDGTLVVVCATDLAEDCSAFGGEVEVRAQAAGDTAAAVIDGTLADDVDAWITTTAWIEVVDSRAPGRLGTAEALASSPAVVATAPGRFEAISALCSGQDVWACLGTAAGRPWASLGDGSHAEWGELKVGLTDPDSATGLSVLAAAAVGYFGTADFAANDPSFADFEAWLATLAEPSGAGDPDPARTLAIRAGAYSAAGSTRVAADRVSARGVQVIEPDVPVAATVVGVAPAGRGELPDLGALRRSFEDGGWASPGPDASAPTLKPGVMAALLTLWRAVTS